MRKPVLSKSEYQADRSEWGKSNRKQIRRSKLAAQEAYLDGVPAGDFDTKNTPYDFMLPLHCPYEETVRVKGFDTEKYYSDKTDNRAVVQLNRFRAQGVFNHPAGVYGERLKKNNPVARDEAISKKSFQSMLKGNKIPTVLKDKLEDAKLRKSDLLEQAELEGVDLSAELESIVKKIRELSAVIRPITSIPYGHMKGAKQASAKLKRDLNKKSKEQRGMRATQLETSQRNIWKDASKRASRDIDSYVHNVESEEV